MGDLTAILLAVIGLAIAAIVLYAIYWAATKVAAAFGAPAHLLMLIQVVFVLIGVYFLVVFLMRHAPVLR